MLISDTGAFEFGVSTSSPATSLIGKRVLITGITSRSGVSIASSFVDAGARVILQCDEANPETQALAETLAPLGDKASAFSDLTLLVNAIAAQAQAGDYILVMSNGGFGGVHQKLLDALAQQQVAVVTPA